MSLWNKIILAILFGVMASSMTACVVADDGYYYRDYAYRRDYWPNRYYYHDSYYHNGYWHSYWSEPRHRWYDD